MEAKKNWNMDRNGVFVMALSFLWQGKHLVDAIKLILILFKRDFFINYLYESVELLCGDLRIIRI